MHVLSCLLLLCTGFTNVLSVDGDSDAVDSLADAVEATGSYTEQLTFMHMVSVATILLLQTCTVHCWLQA
jgi:uncharacterized membrane protein